MHGIVLEIVAMRLMEKISGTGTEPWIEVELLNLIQPNCSMPPACYFIIQKIEFPKKKVFNHEETYQCWNKVKNGRRRH